jgi:hypothetical protein
MLTFEVRESTGWEASSGDRLVAVFTKREDADTVTRRRPLTRRVVPVEVFTSVADFDLADDEPPVVPSPRYRHGGRA